jgi:LPS export ABC transporter permease LptF
MRIADRYIARELLPPFLLGVGGFFVILVGDVLYTLADYIAAGTATPDVIVRLLGYKLPAIMVITFPVSTLFGTLLGLGRLARDHELQAMRLMGTSLVRAFAPVMAFGALIMGLTFLTNEVVSPWANHRANNLIRTTLFGAAFPQVREQVFLRGPGNRFLYVHQVDRDARVLRNVMIYEAEGPLPRLITAREATWSAKTWTLHQGVAREVGPDGFTAYEAGFASMEINVGLDAGEFLTGQRTPEEMTFRELRAQSEMFESGLSPRVAVEFHRKLAVPAASVIFALVAAPLSLQAARGGRFVGVGLSIALLFTYYSVMSVARAFGSSGALSPLLSAWAPNLLFLAAGSLLIAREEGWFRMLVPPRRGRAVGVRL